MLDTENNMHPALDPLRHCTDADAMQEALHALLSTCGTVLRMLILPASQAGRHQALCFVRMETAEQEGRVMRAFGFGRFGEELVIVVPLQQCWQEPGAPSHPQRTSAHAQHPHGQWHTP